MIELTEMQNNILHLYFKRKLCTKKQHSFSDALHFLSMAHHILPFQQGPPILLQTAGQDKSTLGQSPKQA